MEQERIQQVIPVRRAICHPDYNPKTFSKGIVTAGKENSPLALPSWDYIIAFPGSPASLFLPILAA